MPPLFHFRHSAFCLRPPLRRVHPQAACCLDQPPDGRIVCLVSAIALPDFERDIRAALARVVRGESLVVVDGDKQIAQITPPPQVSSLAPKSSSLVDFFLNSPLRESGIEFERDPSAERDTPAL